MSYRSKKPTVSKSIHFNINTDMTKGILIDIDEFDLELTIYMKSHVFVHKIYELKDPNFPDNLFNFIDQLANVTGFIIRWDHY